MTQTILGDRIARGVPLALVCSAVVLDANGRLLLTKRADNGKWCLPGGHLESGETVSESIVREVKEETGLDVEILRITGVYSNPHRVLVYDDGNRAHVVALNFEVRILGGSLTVSDETTAFGWYSATDLAVLNVVDSHVERITDALAGSAETCVR